MFSFNAPSWRESNITIVRKMEVFWSANDVGQIPKTLRSFLKSTKYCYPFCCLSQHCEKEILPLASENFLCCFLGYADISRAKESKSAGVELSGPKSMLPEFWNCGRSRDHGQEHSARIWAAGQRRKHVEGCILQVRLLLICSLGVQWVVVCS